LNKLEMMADETQRQAAAALFVACVAAKLLSRLKWVRACSTALAEPPPRADLAFEADPALHGILKLENDGRHWLTLTHVWRPVGTLLRLHLGGGAGPGWQRFAVLRPGFATSPPTARVCVEAGLQGEERHRLRVDVYAARARLEAEDAEPLWGSYATAANEDPQASSAWRQWATEALQGEQPDEVRRVLERIAGGEPGPAASGPRMATLVAVPLTGGPCSSLC
jgi:hypothetical protein